MACCISSLVIRPSWRGGQFGDESVALEREPLLVVPKIGIHLGSAPERSPRWATGFEEWIDVEAGEDGRRESLVRPMARNGVRPRRPLYGA